MPRLIVTRPLREAQQWARDLADQGLEALALPLITIGPPGEAEVESLRQARLNLADYAAVMFVSANAADYFFISNRPLAPVFTAQAAIKTRATPVVSLAEGRIALRLGWSHKSRAADDLIRKCVAWTWRVKLSLSTERDLFTRLREDAEKVAIKVFADNLRDLLLAAPAGPRVVLGLDPGIRTGVKVAVVDTTGKLVETSTVFPHEPRKDWEGSLHILGKLCEKHGVNLIAIGNGTASRETDKLAAD